MNKLEYNFISIKAFFIIHYSLFILVPLSLLIYCSKTPTSSNEKEQIIITGSITENTVWESGKEYVIREVVTVEGDAPTGCVCGFDWPKGINMCFKVYELI